MIVPPELAKKYPAGSVQPGKSRICDNCRKLITVLYSTNNGKDACSGICRELLEEKKKSPKEDRKVKKDTKKPETKSKKVAQPEIEEPDEDDVDVDVEPEEDDEADGGDPEEDDEETSGDPEEDEEEEAPRKKTAKPVAKKKVVAKATKRSAKSDDDDEEDESPRKPAKKKAGKKNGSSLRPIRVGTEVRKMFLRLAKATWVDREALFQKVEKPYHKLFYIKTQAQKHGWDWKEKGKPATAFKLTVPKSDLDILLSKD